jgi:hypothetical protein
MEIGGAKTAPRAVLDGYAQLISELRGTGKPLFGLFGGYFTLMLRKIGLGCFSNAVGYGENRDSGYSSGGQAIRRYYIPRLHRYFSDVEAQSLIELVNAPWFRCPCPVCAGGRRVTDLTSQELLEHFLNARYSELIVARERNLEELLDELNQTVERLRQIEIPRFPLPYLHLIQWNAALRTYVG